MKRLLLFMLLTALSVIAFSQGNDSLSEEQTVLRQKEYAKRMGSRLGLDARVALEMRYIVKSRIKRQLLHLLSAREEQKVMCNLTEMNILDRVQKKMMIDSIYQDSIDILLIPYNKYITGENMQHAMNLCATTVEFNDVRQRVTDKALDIARRLRRIPVLDVWDEEIGFIVKTLSKDQLYQFFMSKNAASINRDTKEVWEWLKENSLTTDLDSAKENPLAENYFYELYKFRDIYRNKPELKERNISAIHKPRLIKMSDALMRKEQEPNEVSTRPKFSGLAW